MIANTEAAFHFADAIQNEVRGNTLRGNARNFLFSGNTTGNIIQDNAIFGGAALPGFRHLSAPLPPRASPGAEAVLARLQGWNGSLTIDSLWHLLQPSVGDSHDLAWFKSRLFVSLFD